MITVANCRFIDYQSNYKPALSLGDRHLPNVIAEVTHEIKDFLTICDFNFGLIVIDIFNHQCLQLLRYAEVWMVTKFLRLYFVILILLKSSKHLRILRQKTRQFPEDS